MIGWAWVSPTLLCLMLSLVCMVWLVVRTWWLVWLAQPGHSYRAPLLPPRVPPILSFTEQVLCPTVKPRLNNTCTSRGKGWQLRLRKKESLHCVAYALLPHSCSPQTYTYCTTEHIYTAKIIALTKLSTMRIVPNIFPGILNSFHFRGTPYMVTCWTLG